MMFPYGWLVYGVPTEKGVRLTASRGVRAQLEYAQSGRFRDNPEVGFSATMTRVEIIEAESWRAALEELYRRWKPAPDGNVL